MGDDWYEEYDGNVNSENPNALRVPVLPLPALREIALSAAPSATTPFSPFGAVCRCYLYLHYLTCIS